MAGADQVSHVGIGLDTVTHIPQRGQVGHAQRNLVDHAERQVRRAACGQNDLVVFGRVSTEEDQLHRPQIAAIGFKETHHVFVKAGHAF